MPYPKFLAWNAAGGLAGASPSSCSATPPAPPTRRVEKTFGRDAAVVVLAIVIVGLVVWRIRKHRAERRAGTARS